MLENLSLPLLAALPVAVEVQVSVVLHARSLAAVTVPLMQVVLWYSQRTLTLKLWLQLMAAGPMTFGSKCTTMVSARASVLGSVDCQCAFTYKRAFTGMSCFSPVNWPHDFNLKLTSDRHRHLRLHCCE